jgi:hypothetical protein
MSAQQQAAAAFAQLASEQHLVLLHPTHAPPNNERTSNILEASKRRCA